MYLLGGDPRITVEVSQIIPAVDFPPDLHSFGIAPDTRLDKVQVNALTTSTGWPLVLRQADIIDARGQVRETRLVAELHFSIFASTVIVRAPSQGALAIYREEIVQTIEQVRPRLRGRAPVAIVELRVATVASTVRRQLVAGG